MVQIPELTRQRLASSVVGTPPLDTSGQKIGESLANTGQTVAADVGERVLQIQQSRDLAEKATLSAQAEMGSFKDIENLKIQYANEPEKVLDHVLPLMQQHVTAVQGQASNPRVKLMLGQTDPYFTRGMILNTQRWAFDQRGRVDKANIESQTNAVFDTAEQFGAADKPYVEKLDNFKTLAAMGGNLVGGAFAVAHPDSAAELKAKFLPTAVTRMTYGMLNSNPAQAVQFLGEKSVKDAFSSNPKELEELHNLAVQKVEGLAKDIQWKQITAQLVDSPQLLEGIASRKVDWNTLEAMPEGPSKTEFQKMALNLYPQENGQQRDVAMAKFFADAADMHMKFGLVPREKTVSDLVKFNGEITHAFNEGFITQADHRMMTSKLMIPLRDAVLKAHDPEQLQAVRQKTGWFNWGKQKEPDEVMDQYVGGYNVINNWLKANGKDQDWTTKTQAIQKYIENSDKAKPEDRDSSGRPYTPQSLAQKALGIAVGDTIDTPFGKKVITNHDAQGMPTYEITKEEMDWLNHQKAMKAIRR